MKLRHLITWKFLYYDVTLPTLQRLGASRADAIIGLLGRLVSWATPQRRVAIQAAVARASDALGAGWDEAATTSAVAANTLRYLARDYPLDLRDDARVLDRFDVSGEANLREAMAMGRGVVLVGSHLGAHVAGLHWLHRRGLPVRLLVQRPNHVSNTLRVRFDRPEQVHPQSKLFLRRGLTTPEAADRLLRARAALRDGMMIYLNGDIPWTGPNARPGRLLGLTRTFLAIWADLALLARSPVVFVTCVHAPRGRFAIAFSAPIALSSGDEQAAVTAYLAHLEAAIATHPADAVAHLTWPCFGPGTPEMPCERARLRQQA